MHSPSQISAISRLFSVSVFKEMAKTGKSPLFAKLMKEVNSKNSVCEARIVHGVFDRAYKVLRNTNCRHEYIYKAALTHKILLGTHSLQTASMLNEFRVRDCKADVAILNGTATVYEIKSERDSLSRLEKQVETYKHFFAKVYVIAGENHLENIKSIVSGDVGILRLSERHQISTIREAENRPERTSPLIILESIRTVEAKAILKLANIPIPDVPNTEMHAALKDRFSKLAPVEAHSSMVRVLKRTRNLLPLSELIDNLPISLQSAALTVPLRRADHERLITAINTPLQSAMAWG